MISHFKWPISIRGHQDSTTEDKDVDAATSILVTDIGDKKWRQKAIKLWGLPRKTENL